MSLWTRAVRSLAGRPIDSATITLAKEKIMGLFSRRPRTDTLALAVDFLRQSAFTLTQAGPQRYIAEDPTGSRMKINVVGTGGDVLVMGGYVMGLNAKADPGRFNWYLQRIQEKASVASFTHDPDYNLAAVGSIAKNSDAEGVRNFFDKWNADIALASTGEEFADEFKFFLA